MEKKSKTRGKKTQNELSDIAYRAGEEIGTRLNKITGEGGDVIDGIIEEIRAKPMKAALYSLLAGFIVGRFL